MLAALLLPASIQNPTLDAIFERPGLKTAWIGALVVDAEGKTLYSRNAEVNMIPASNQKLLSVAYALWRLGPEFRPVTRIWKLEDRIVVDAPGDPSMTYAKLAEANKQLALDRRMPVFVRQGYRPGWGPGWEWDDLPNRYAPAISAFTIDRGGFELWGNPDKFYFKPANFGVSIREMGGKVSRRRFNLSAGQMTVFGPNPKQDSFVEGFAIPEPDRAAAMVLGGPLFETDTLPTTEPTLTLTGKSIGEMAKDCLVPSDNFLGESLLMLAAKADGPLGDNEYATAQARMREFLTKTVGMRDVEPVDGSGLSRHNNLSARDIATLLRWAQQQPTAALWNDALASPANGTLRSRLAGSSFRGKTGTLNKVVSLSGYCMVNGRSPVIVSVIVNHFSGGSAVARNAVDDFIRKVEEGALHGTKLAANSTNGLEAVPDPGAGSSLGNWVY